MTTKKQAQLLTEAPTEKKAASLTKTQAHIQYRRLLTVGFKNLGDEKATTETRYSWMPQWETVRQLIFSAIIVEAFKRVGNQELSDFEACITLCQKVRNNLSGLLSGQMGIES